MGSLHLLLFFFPRQACIQIVSVIDIYLIGGSDGSTESVESIPLLASVSCFLRVLKMEDSSMNRIACRGLQRKPQVRIGSDNLSQQVCVSVFGRVAFSASDVCAVAHSGGPCSYPWAWVPTELQLALHWRQWKLVICLLGSQTWLWKCYFTANGRPQTHWADCTSVWWFRCSVWMGLINFHVMVEYWWLKHAL